jgi:hypothetical protein
LRAGERGSVLGAQVQVGERGLVRTLVLAPALETRELLAPVEEAVALVRAVALSVALAVALAVAVVVAVVVEAAVIAVVVIAA